MRYKLIVLGVTLGLMIGGLSGCTEKSGISTQDNLPIDKNDESEDSTNETKKENETQEPTIQYDVPYDLEIEYSYCKPRLHSGAYIESITIHANGTVFFSSGWYPKIKQKTYYFTDKEIFEIYNEILSNHFFELNETYPPRILDGPIFSLQVNADDQQHKVSFHYYTQDVMWIQNIVEKIVNNLH